MPLTMSKSVGKGAGAAEPTRGRHDAALLVRSRQLLPTQDIPKCNTNWRVSQVRARVLHENRNDLLNEPVIARESKRCNLLNQTIKRERVGEIVHNMATRRGVPKVDEGHGVYLYCPNLNPPRSDTEPSRSQASACAHPMPHKPPDSRWERNPRATNMLEARRPAQTEAP